MAVSGASLKSGGGERFCSKPFRAERGIEQYHWSRAKKKGTIREAESRLVGKGTLLGFSHPERFTKVS